MTEEIVALAQRIKELRDIFGFDTETIANKLMIPANLYEQYETLGQDIPISVIYRLAGIYNVDMTDLLSGKSPKLNTLSVVRKGEGLVIERFKGYEYENIAFKFLHRKMEPLIVVLKHDDRKPEMVTHSGQELNYCLEGTMILYYDNDEIILNPGDCAYFDPTHPHGQRAAGNEKAVFLTVIHE